MQTIDGNFICQANYYHAVLRPMCDLTQTIRESVANSFYCGKCEAIKKPQDEAAVFSRPSTLYKVISHLQLYQLAQISVMK
jgi:hypothetical protein